MTDFSGILICTDLDGTLLSNDLTISKENKEAIAYFQAHGGYFTFVTGRMPFFVEHIYTAIAPNAPFGCINGGGLYDHRAGRYIWLQELTREVLPLLEAVDRAFPHVGIQVNTPYCVYFCKENDTMRYFREATGVQNLVRGYREVEEPFAKIVFGSQDGDELEAVAHMLRSHPLAEQFDFIRSERTLFEILPRGIGKGVAIAKLSECLGIDPHKTVAIGDYNNDISMFRSAALGIAVANACPEAKAAADAVTVSNEEHAIARVINDLEHGVYALA